MAVMDLMQRRRLTASKERLPSAYQEVEWIETGEDCYFLTDYYPNTASGYIIEVSFINGWGHGTRNTTPASDGIAAGSFGCLYSSARKEIRLDYSNKQAMMKGLNIKDFRIINRHINGAQRYAIQNRLTSQNIDAGSFVSPASFTCNYPLAICALNNAGTIVKYVGTRLYVLRLSENNIIIHDYVPCYRKSDGEIGLFDKITKEFLTNAGAGTFLKGADV